MTPQTQDFCMVQCLHHLVIPFLMKISCEIFVSSFIPPSVTVQVLDIISLAILIQEKVFNRPDKNSFIHLIIGL